MILTPDQFREHMADEVALSDDALKVMLDANEAAILAWAGPMGTVTETVYAKNTTLLPLRFEPQSVTLVTDVLDTTETELVESDDFRIRGRYLERVWPYWWSDRTTVQYVSTASAARYITTLVKLMKCDLNYEPGMSSQSAGPWQESYSTNHQAERQRILDELRPAEIFA